MPEDRGFRDISNLFKKKPAPAPKPTSSPVARSTTTSPSHPPPVKAPPSSQREPTATLKFRIPPEAEAITLPRQLVINECPRLADLPRSRDGTIELLDKGLKPEAFGLAIYWMRNHTLPERYVRPESIAGSAISRNGLKLWHVYVVAWKIKLYGLQNEIMDYQWTHYRRRPSKFKSLEMLSLYTEYGLVGSPFYMFVVKSGLWALMNDTIKVNNWKDTLDYLEECPPAMRDLLFHISKWASKPWKKPGQDDRCDYHIHADKDTKCDNEPETLYGMDFGSGPGQADENDNGEPDSESETLHQNRLNGNGKPN